VITARLIKSDDVPFDILVEMELEHSGRFSLMVTLSEAREIAEKLILITNAQVDLRINGQ